ncbi:hypothetical protein [Rickettsia endosymbiont of Gonocerus acuteangulatus]|uniref:hypothetical protein n=1 Tax=Rickettsia endosymbiont of Gonocerus acuteangulatus TaxID=3066266 RepID=UPI0031333C9C
MQSSGESSNAQGRTAMDFLTQVSNIVHASGGNLKGLVNIAPDIINNPQNTNSQPNVQS